MIRPARAIDIPAIETMLREQHAASKYKGRCDISDKAMRALLEGSVAMQGQNGPHASIVLVAEEQGKPMGFMVGTLSRIYLIGTKLVAQDVYLCVRPRAKPAHALQMIDRYIAWARANPKVIEIMLSWSDALPGAERIATVYGRKGLTKSGEMFEMRLDAQEVGIAA